VGPVSDCRHLTFDQMLTADAVVTGIADVESASRVQGETMRSVESCPNRRAPVT
jgi:hypothetical protein